MKPIIEKVLQSGIVDKAGVKLLEQWGYLPEGSSEKVKDDALQNATKETLNKLAEDLATEIDKEYKIRETHLDLERIRWPATVNIFQFDNNHTGGTKYLAREVPAVMDRMGRYYFRIQDVKEGWFVPGYVIERTLADSRLSLESVIEKQVLDIGDQPACIQVSVIKTIGKELLPLLGGE